MEVEQFTHLHNLQRYTLLSFFFFFLIIFNLHWIKLDSSQLYKQTLSQQADCDYWNKNIEREARETCCLMGCSITLSFNPSIPCFPQSHHFDALIQYMTNTHRFVTKCSINHRIESYTYAIFQGLTVYEEVVHACL